MLDWVRFDVLLQETYSIFTEITEWLRLSRGLFECSDVIEDIEKRTSTPCLSTTRVVTVCSILICPAAKVRRQALAGLVRAS